MSGWPGDDEQSQAVYDDDSPHLYINYTADPLMGLPIYPDHRHDQVVHHSFLLHPGHNVVAAVPQAQGSHHALDIAHPVPRYGIPPVFYTAWSMSRSPDPPLAMHTGGASMHQNVSYPEHGSSQQPEITVPTLSLEPSNILSSQSSVTLEPPSHYNLDDITQHAKISYQCGKVGPARAIFKTAKLVGMERAQLAREIQAGASSATAQSSSKQSSEADVKIVPGSGTRKLLERFQVGMRKAAFNESILLSIGSLGATVDSSWQAMANELQGKSFPKLQDWAMEMMKDKNYVDEKMGSVIDEVSEEICGVAQIFTYQCYELDFSDMAVLVKKSDIDKRANHIQGLLKDDIFIYGKLFSVDEADLGTITFTSPAII
ncbi:uncharacterized protein F5147DRAFT_778357 [Suillus discolor]|uniref:Uncharacterized protein n=1 Tax=Suillus discolor TaxID=1912936 RepID=A0A9P7EYL6_9AGAM|nr:uncharacterized protein F5147DRAFT_778357 [Suillus discolor]KAG2096310.1 hypothetical protein F5147DRAFT_778357 [Suillus discolor]